MRVVAAGLVLVLLAGCVGGPDDDPSGPQGGTGTTVTPPSIGPPLVFGGTLLDARSGAPLANATVRLDLAQVQPCARQGIGWSSWDLAYADGRFGPFEVPRPRSDEVAFFLHATAPGYAENATMIGPTEARGDLGNLTLVLHPDAAIAGTAPAGTLLALDAPRFPRLAVADANGTFRFDHARVVEAALVADTAAPYRALVTAPADISIDATEARGWRVEGTVKRETGTPLASDLVAYRDGALVGVARSGDTGAFAMPLPAEPGTYRIAARTGDARYGATLTLELDGPPALRQTLVARALC